MDKKIIVKEIDKLTSSISKERVITEYLIYLTNFDTKTEAFIEIGENAKNIRVNELLLLHFSDTDNSIENIVEEITYEEYNNQLTERKKNMEKENTQGYPLILVFYLDREMMRNPQIIQPFADSVNDMLASKNANIMAFFLPTDGEEFVDCINPVMVKDADMENINKMIKDIKENFSVGSEMNVPNEDIITDKPCVCENGGECNCNN